MTSSTASRVWATGLAGLTCLGITAGVTMRAQSLPPAAATASTSEMASAAAETYDYNPEQLAAYKAQLDAEALRLKAYRKALVKLSRGLPRTPSQSDKKGNKTVASSKKQEQPVAPSPSDLAPAPAAPPELAQPALPPTSDGSTHSS